MALFFYSQMKSGTFIFLLVCFVLTAHIIGLAVRWDRGLASVESRFISNDPDETNPAASGRMFLDNDASYWIHYVREMVESGTWRIRHTFADNPPEGRPVHWSQSVSWLLLGCGAIRSAIMGESLFEAIEPASIWVGPLTLILLLLISGWYLHKRLGLAPALIWMINLSAITVLGWYFHPLRPDHHGLQMAFLTGSLMALMLGGLGWFTRQTSSEPDQIIWFRMASLPAREQARRAFVWSGVLGGLGLWTGATVQLFGIGLVAAGAMLLIFFMPSAISDPKAEYEPRLWRWWAVSGSLASLFFYAIEYAPDFPGLRLEVNHPLYAFAWFCAGEAMVRLSRIRLHGGTPDVRQLSTLTAWMTGAAVLPLMLWLGPDQWHAMKNVYMSRMHTHILEFMPYIKSYQWSVLGTVFGNFGFLPVFLLIAPFLTGRNKTQLYEWALLWMAFLPALAYAILTLIQVRWSPFFILASLLLAIMTLSIVARHSIVTGASLRWISLVVVSLLIQPAVSLYGQSREIQSMHKPGVIVNDLGKVALQRQLASRLGALNTNGTFRLLAEPDVAARFMHYGKIPVVSSFYWENVDGLVDTMLFMSDLKDEGAARIVRERGITHVLIPRTATIAHIFHYIRHGYFSETGARDSLAGRLLTRTNNVPDWLVRDVDLLNHINVGYTYSGQPLQNTVDLYVVAPERLP